MEAADIAFERNLAEQARPDRGPDWIVSVTMLLFSSLSLFAIAYCVVKFEPVRFIFTRYLAPFLALAALVLSLMLIPGFGEGRGIPMPAKQGHATERGSTFKGRFEVPSWLRPGSPLLDAAAWIIPAAAAALAVAALVGGVRFIRKAPAEPRGPEGGDGLAAGAHRAIAMLDDFSSYGGEKEAVIRAWSSFQAIAETELGKRRSSEETAREFRDELAGFGVDRDALAELTSLFERARYSPGALSATDVLAARASFARIAESCAKRKASPRGKDGAA
jgi:hypothetical protein